MAVALALGVAGLGALIMQSSSDDNEDYLNESDAEPEDLSFSPPSQVRDGVAEEGDLEYRNGPSHVNVPQDMPYNPIRAREVANSVPGRYDNLPMLQNVFKDTQHELQPFMASDFNYMRKDNAPTTLDRQFTMLTNDTPLDHGVLPQMGRGTGVMLRDPGDPSMLKPQKRENLDTDYFGTFGDPLASRYVPITDEAHRRANAASKTNSGSGALNDYMPTDNPGDGLGGSNLGNNATRGYAQGEIQTPRQGGFHPRERFHRVAETRRGRNQHGFRALNPSSNATGKLGSIYQMGTAPLGELRENANADVRDWGREALPTGGLRQMQVGNEFVDMKHSDRDPGNMMMSSFDRPLMGDTGGRRRRRNAQGMSGRQETPQYNPDDVFETIDPAGMMGTERSWAGPGGNSNMAQESRRETDMYVRPKNLNDFQLEGWETAAHDSQVGAYINEDYSMDLKDRMTNRTIDSDRVSRAPAPSSSGRGNSSAYNFQDTLRAGRDRTVRGRAPGPSRAEDGVADGFSGRRFQEVDLRYTQKADPQFTMREAVWAPLADRQMAMQQPMRDSFPCPVTRRQQPTVENDIDFDGAQAYRNNPYTQSLPHPYPRSLAMRA